MLNDYEPHLVTYHATVDGITVTQIQNIMIPMVGFEHCLLIPTYLNLEAMR